MLIPMGPSKHCRLRVWSLAHMPLYSANLDTGLKIERQWLLQLYVCPVVSGVKMFQYAHVRHILYKNITILQYSLFQLFSSCSCSCSSANSSSKVLTICSKMLHHFSRQAAKLSKSETQRGFNYSLQRHLCRCDC